MTETLTNRTKVHPDDVTSVTSVANAKDDAIAEAVWRRYNKIDKLKRILLVLRGEVYQMIDKKGSIISSDLPLKIRKVILEIESQQSKFDNLRDRNEILMRPMYSNTRESAYDYVIDSGLYNYDSKTFERPSKYYPWICSGVI